MVLDSIISAGGTAYGTVNQLSPMAGNFLLMGAIAVGIILIAAPFVLISEGVGR